MNLYILDRKDEIDYDEAKGFVIRAESSDEARKIAAGYCGYEGSDLWLDEARSSCQILSTEGEKEIILRSFNAG